MRLSDYLQENQIAAPDFARLIGCDKGTVYRWIKGEVIPMPDTIGEIMNATGGAVTFEDFLEERARARKHKSEAVEQTP